MCSGLFGRGECSLWNILEDYCEGGKLLFIIILIWEKYADLNSIL